MKTNEEASPKPWRTSIAVPLAEEVVVRGERLSDLIGKTTFAEMFCLILRGTAPSPGEGRVIDALLVSLMEHGISPSTMVSRLLATYGVPLQAGFAAGALTIGDIHGGAGLQLAEALQSLAAEADLAGCPTPEDLETSARTIAEQFVADRRRSRLPVEGFGHPQHSSDPRCPALFSIAREEGVYGVHCALVSAMESALQEAVGRRIPVNIDGAVAALILDMGFDPRIARLIVLVGRSVGLGAHFIEEQDQGTRWRHVDQSEVAYEGPGAERLPASSRTAP